MRYEEERLTVKEAAKRYKVHADTIRAWVRKGLLPHERVGPHGIIRIRPSDMARVVKPEDQHA